MGLRFLFSFIFLPMILKRNLTSHTYNEEVTESIVNSIIEQYHTCFIDFQAMMEKFAKQ